MSERRGWQRRIAIIARGWGPYGLADRVFPSTSYGMYEMIDLPGTRGHK